MRRTRPDADTRAQRAGLASSRCWGSAARSAHDETCR
jgi:hypothetical protein